MNKLKKYIVKLFLAVIIPLAVIISMLDSLFNTIAEMISDESTMLLR